MSTSVSYPRERHVVRAALVPLLVLPALALLLTHTQPAWIQMPIIAVAIYAGCKWFTFADYAAENEVRPWRSLAYLFLWPGMDAENFCNPHRSVETPRPREYFAAMVKIVLGALLVFAVFPRTVNHHPQTSAWIGATGLILLLHSGVMHALSIGWRAAGIRATPLMRSPMLARSLADFWGWRWNTAFHDLVDAHLFRPVLKAAGPVRATLAVFIVSGLIHDFAMSIPPGGGYGLPTLYFLLQAIGLLAERSAAGKRLGLGSGLRGRAFAAALVVLPLPLLFHAAFRNEVMLPLLSAMNLL